MSSDQIGCSLKNMSATTKAVDVFSQHREGIAVVGHAVIHGAKTSGGTTGAGAPNTGSVQPLTRIACRVHATGRREMPSGDPIDFHQILEDGMERAKELK